MGEQNPDLEVRLNMADWKIDGNFEAVVKAYAQLDDAPSEDVAGRRKALAANLKAGLLIPSQQLLVDYLAQNAGRIQLFELGGTFRSITDNFLPILYADILTAEISRSGMPSLSFLIIDPSDVSRAQRTLHFGGKNYKIPLPVSKVADGKTTAAVAPPKPQDIAPLFDEMEREIGFYFDGVFREHGSFKEDFTKKQACRAVLGSMRDRLAALKQKAIEVAQRNRTYREFTDGFYASMIGGFLKNTICVTLKQWQSGWNIKEILTDPSIYNLLRDSGEVVEITEPDAKDKNPELARSRLSGMRAYTFPFRIDRDGWVFQDPLIDMNKGEVWAQRIELGRGDPLKFTPDDLVGEKSVLLPQGSLLYALDSLMYNAIPMATFNDRFERGHKLAQYVTKPKPFAGKRRFSYFSVGRKTASEPEEKTSGVVAAVIEGDSSERLKSMLTGDKTDVYSPAYEKYRQPSA